MAEWINEREKYNFIEKIPFFHNFKIWRIIKMWRKNIFRQKKIACQNELQACLLFNNKDYNSKLVKHKAHCNRMLLEPKILDTTIRMDALSWGEFQTNQIALRTKTKKKLDEVHNDSETIFKNALRTIFSQVQQKINKANNDTNRTDEPEDLSGQKGNQRQEVYKENTGDDELLNEDEIVGFDNFKYQDKVLIKDECKNFVKLAYLFDYIMLDVLRRLFLFSMKDILQKFKKYNEAEVPKRKENLENKNGDYIKPQVSNQNRNVPFITIECLLNPDFNIDHVDSCDKIKKMVKPFFVKATPDEEFDPSAHLQKDTEEEEYQRLLKEKKNPQDYMTPNANIKNEFETTEIKDANRYFIKFKPDFNEIIAQIGKEITQSIENLKIDGWRAHQSFKKYIKYMDDWDEKYGDWSGGKAREIDIASILSEDDLYSNKDKLIEEQVLIAQDGCKEYLAQLDPFLQLHWKQLSIKKEILLDEYLKDSDEMFKLIFYFSEKSKKKLEKNIPYEEEIRLFKLSLEGGLRKSLSEAQNSTIDFLKLKYPELLIQRTKDLKQWYDDMLREVKFNQEIGIDSEELFLQKNKAKETVELWFDINERKLLCYVSIAQLLKNKNFSEISAEDLKKIESINSDKNSLKRAWDLLTDELGKRQDKLYSSLQKGKLDHLNEKVRELKTPLKNEAYITWSDEPGKVNGVLLELMQHEKTFQKHNHTATIYNEFLNLIDQPPMDLSVIEEIRELLDATKGLWTALKEMSGLMEKWKQMKGAEFKPQVLREIEDKLDELEGTARKAESVLGKGTATRKLLKDVTDYSNAFKVISYLHTECLMNKNNKYLEQIQDLFRPDAPSIILADDHTLEIMMTQIGIQDKEEEIQKIKTMAVKHQELERKITEIITARSKVQFVISADKKFITNDIAMIESLEELQSKINIIAADKYAMILFGGPDKPSAKNPINIKNSLELALNNMENIKMFQKKYKYLESILNAGDMKRKLTDISLTFDKAEGEWKAKLNKTPCPDHLKRIGELNDVVNNQMKNLDMTQRLIEDQLTLMRNYFERFYFISNDDLLFMLSNSKSNDVKEVRESVNKIKPYLSKVFEDIYDLKLNINETTMSKEIISIFGLSKEECVLKQGCKIQDELEKWLWDLRQKITDTIKEKMGQAFKSYAEIDDKDKNAIKENEKWIENYAINDPAAKREPGDTPTKPNLSQIVATVTHAKFVAQTEKEINDYSRSNNTIEIWLDKIDKIINIYSEMVNGDFSTRKNVRRIISNLITHYVHYKDIIKDLFENMSCDYASVNDFIWQKQLRIYFVGEGGQQITEQNFDRIKLDVRVRQLKFDYEYGYEYFGPSTRLVISPLTDRVWLTMTSGLNIGMGCSLGGPAGTGKTETTKDLAKFLGIQCIVFNCSDQIDYKILGNIFSGLCKHANGAFACLDEFNRISEEVLSVVATQLFKIRQAQLEMKAEEKEGKKDKKGKVTIMTDEIDLIGKGGVFVTMNPTYAGRTELPDNLKANFRPITMMKPEFAKIAQVKLFSEGFKKADVLSRKLHKLYELAEQQLSRQDHYDFTLRTLGTVLSMAGNKKRKVKIAPGQEIRIENEIVIEALRDANFPKFITDDIKLFSALLTDLFPGNEILPHEDKYFEEELTNIIVKNKMYPCEFTKKKSFELIDLLSIRLGICLTGSAGTGKSACIKLVEEVCTTVQANNPNCGPLYKNVKSWNINPKSITMGELYGEENEEKKTFEYGIATKKIKKALTQEAEENYRWIILDGPIDTVWIENMNSVLDDSQTLCLANGERIKLKSHMKIIFEVEDLSKASLATVSRLGVIYFGPTELGWKPYAQYWINTYLDGDTILNEELKKYVSDVFDDKMDDAIDNLNDLYNSGLVYFKPSISCLVASLCYFLEYYLTKEHGFIGKDMKDLDNPDQIGIYKKKIIMCFALSMVWGVFGCVSAKGQTRVESFIRNRFGEIKMESNQGIMDYYYDFEKEDFTEYTVSDNSFKYKLNMPYHSIFVPTTDSVKYSQILKILINSRKNVYVTGETGSGKTAVIQAINSELLATDEWTNILINFSAKTSSKEAQNSLESKFEQRAGKKKLWGKGGKKCLIFIDDINMPEPNEWGSHPPIELLRQFLDRGGFYDRPGLFWKTITNTNMIVAGGPPVGGRSLLTNRFTRHFAIICFPQPAKQILNSIFENILKGFFTEAGFIEKIRKHEINTTSSTMELFEDILKNLKPIPSKFHYIFNLRDVGRVFQGLLMIEAKSFNDPEKYVRLWMNEVQRVFCDRLICEEDIQKVNQKISELVVSKFKMEQWDKEKIQEKHFFGEVHKGYGVAKREYEHIDGGLETLRKELQVYVNEYNIKNKSAKIKFVFFEYFIDHILRICRILRQPRGHSVLIGHGGSGKQSVCKLSSFIMTGKSEYFETFTVGSDLNVKKFKAIIKDIIKRSGQHSRVLLLNDNNVCYDFILENINNLLNNGEIPNLLENEYMAKAEDKIQFTSYEQFVEETRKNLHVLFCTSPVGDLLRVRVRRFPALLNCCSLDWFMPWPTEALFSCCTSSLDNSKLMDEDTKKKFVDLMVEAHKQIEKLKEDFYVEMGRRVYVTPKTFLDMVNLMLEILEKKKEQREAKINILDQGTKKLEVTKEEIGKLNVMIEKLIPQIKQKGEEIAAKKVLIDAKKEEVEAESIKVVESTAKVKEAQKEVSNLLVGINADKADCEMKFKEIKEAAAKNISENTILGFQKEKALGEFAEAKKTFLVALAHLLTSKKVNKIDKDKAYLDIKDNKDKIYNIDKYITGDKPIPDEIFDSFKKLIYETIPKLAEKYRPDLGTIEAKFKNNSETQLFMYTWSKDVISLWEKQKELRPLIEQSKEKSKLRDELVAELDALKKKKQQKEQESESLEKEGKIAEETLERLKEESEINTTRKGNAEKLLDQLADERERWIEQLKNLRADEKNFLGNYLLSTLFISYLSPFNGAYRQRQLMDWTILCKHQKISISDDFSLKDVMSDQVEIRSWNVCGLPSDNVSIENAIMLTNNTKYPLLIDPQLQGNKWLKKFYTGKEKKFTAYKAELKVKEQKSEGKGNEKGREKDPAVEQLERIEKDITEGNIALLENCTEEIDSVYAPIVGQSIYDDGMDTVMNFNGKTLVFNFDFKMFFTTKLSNPHYPPEFFIKLNIINFTVTQSGLSEQLLSEVFKSEKRDQFEARDRAIEKMGEKTEELRKSTEEILKELASVNQDEILDDNKLIEMLENSKKASAEVKVEMKQAMLVDAETSKIRDKYVPIATRGSILYFVVSDLFKIDPMYQFSLEYFTKVFNKSIGYKEEQSKTIEDRVQFLVKKITEDIFKNIKRGLFESHKSIFSFLIITSILKNDEIISENEWNFFVKGVSNFDATDMPTNPDDKYFSEFQWNSVLYYESKFKYNGFAKTIKSKLEDIKKFFEEINNLNNDFDKFLDVTFSSVKNYEEWKERRFRKLILIKIFKPEKLVFFTKKFIGDELGEIFIDTTASRLEEVYQESDWKTPIIFILSKGADPTNDFIVFKEKFQKMRIEEIEAKER
ncbi:MAG: AAA family ATPase, partial [archaeon]|nr:AAA family ATPase [archaeon]